jgi:PEP-CTERM motif
MQKNRPLAAIGRRAVTASVLACAALGSQAAVVLTNGSFESIGGSLPAGLFLATGWSNQSGLAIQASSAAAGFELTNASGVTGARFLRLVSDYPDPANTGFIVQNMGTMVAGETYSILGDVLGGRGANLAWGATFRLTSDSGLSPAQVFASQHIAGIAEGAVSANAVNLSYAATAADAGRNLFLWMRADSAAFRTASRGGVDNFRLTVRAAPTPQVPEPSSLALVGLALGLCGWTASRRRSA